MAMPDLMSATITALAAALRQGETTAVEITQAYLARIETLDPKLNAFRLVCGERALEQAARADRQRQSQTDPCALLGIPFAAKDLFDVGGLPTSAGCHLLENDIAGQDCSVISRLTRAGMVLLGKTNTVQFAYGGAGINHDHGTPHNPWHCEHHVPGGSSSGSAVAVAAGLAACALGTDTGGSVRIPASLCGISGLKTTVGQVSRAGVFPLSWTLDSVGPLCHTAEDTAHVYAGMQGEDVRDATTIGRPAHDVLSTLNAGVRGLSLAYPETVFWDSADAEVEQSVRACASVFEELGARVTHIEFEQAEGAWMLNNRGLIAAAEAWTLNRDILENHFDELDPVVAHRMLKGRDISAEEYLNIQIELLRLRSAIGPALESVDALLVPATAIAARPVAELEASTAAYSERNLAYLRNTAIGNTLNLCGLSVPCGFTSDGLPIGLMIYAKPFREDIALRVAHAFQQASDWHQRHPTLERLNHAD